MSTGHSPSPKKRFFTRKTPFIDLLPPEDTSPLCPEGETMSPRYREQLLEERRKERRAEVYDLLRQLIREGGDIPHPSWYEVELLAAKGLIELQPYQENAGASHKRLWDLPYILQTREKIALFVCLDDTEREAQVLHSKKDHS